MPLVYVKGLMFSDGGTLAFILHLKYISGLLTTRFFDLFDHTVFPQILNFHAALIRGRC